MEMKKKDVKALRDNLVKNGFSEEYECDCIELKKSIKTIELSDKTYDIIRHVCIVGIDGYGYCVSYGISVLSGCKKITRLFCKEDPFFSIENNENLVDSFIEWLSHTFNLCLLAETKSYNSDEMKNVKSSLKSNWFVRDKCDKKLYLYKYKTLVDEAQMGFTYLFVNMLDRYYYKGFSLSDGGYEIRFCDDYDIPFDKIDGLLESFHRLTKQW